MEKKKAAVPLVCHGHSRPVVDLFYSPVTPDGYFLISASKDSNPMLRNGETGDWIGTFEGHKGAVWSCCLDTNALRAASGSADFSALWDVRSEKIVQTLETKAPVTSAEVSPDGRFITTADGSTVKFWDANTFGLVKSYDMSFTVESASLEPKSGSKFIAGGEDMWVHVFDFVTGEEITCNKGHHGPVHCVRFAPGGESYASGSEDGTIRIWQLSPANTDAEEAADANGKPKAGVEEVTCKIEGFHIPKEEKKTEE